MNLSGITDRLANVVRSIFGVAAIVLAACTGEKRRRLGSTAAAILPFLILCAQPASADPISVYGAYVSGGIENTFCPPNASALSNPNCVFDGTSPQTFTPLVTSASGSLSDGYASISGSADLGTRHVAVSMQTTGAPFSGDPNGSNPAGILAVIFDTLTFHFADPNMTSEQVTIRMTRSGSTTGVDARLRYDLWMQSIPGGPFPPNCCFTDLPAGPFDIATMFTVQDAVPMEFYAGLRAEQLPSPFLAGPRPAR